MSTHDHVLINRVLHTTRLAITGRIRVWLDRCSDLEGAYRPLYALLGDYPFRKGKMLRPGICVAVTRACGGRGEDALSPGTALELYHNAFLIHDDIEDGSEHRRGGEALQHRVGVPRAINAGDATNVLAMGLLLDGLNSLDVGRTLAILHEIEFMARQSAEGQAMELDWVADNQAGLGDEDYFRMCAKKTCWYSFITPCRVGMIAGAGFQLPAEETRRYAALTRFGLAIGIAFQIQDDLLNLDETARGYGKEVAGDLYEGKRTLMLNHVLLHSPRQDDLLEILARPRRKKRKKDVSFVLEEMRSCGSIEHGRTVARRQAVLAMELLNDLDFFAPTSPLRPGESWEEPDAGLPFLRELVNYVIHRDV